MNGGGWNLYTLLISCTWRKGFRFPGLFILSHFFGIILFVDPSNHETAVNDMKVSVTAIDIYIHTYVNISILLFSFSFV